MVSEAPPAVASPAAAEEEMAPSPEDGTTSIDLVEIDISGEDGAASSADGAAESTVELVGVQTSADRAAEAKRDAVSLVSPTPTADAAAEPDDGPPPHWEKARVAAAPAPAVVDESESECVKVAVRVRPLSAKENAEGSTQCVRFPGNGQIVIVRRTAPLVLSEPPRPSLHMQRSRPAAGRIVKRCRCALPAAVGR